MAESGGKPGCLFCCGEAFFYFDKRGAQGSYHIFQCVSCRSAFTWPRLSQAKSLSLYQATSYGNASAELSDELDMQYYPNSRMDSKRIIARCLAFAPGRAFFDIGAGNGIYSQAARVAGLDVSACEPSPQSRAAFAARLGFEAEPCAFDRSVANHYKNRFDVALLSQTLEHIPDPEEMVRNLRSVLRQEGIAAVAVPHFGSALSRIQGKKDMFISPPEHLNYFSKKGLVRLFKRYGFELVFMETVSKIPKKYVQRILRNRVLTQIGWRAGYGLMRFSDFVGLGMVINAYFRKK